jgi:general secretion pathway protein K
MSNIPRPLRSTRCGYALLAVLWMCAGVATLGLSISAAAREAIGASRNRIALAEGEWIARACVARVRALVTLHLQPERAPTFERATDAWLRLDSYLLGLNKQDIGECAISVRPAGARLNVNVADEQLLARVFRRAGVPAASADSVAAALADWKDADDVPRPMGAEGDWYVSRAMIPPGNRSFADPGEIALVRGVSDVPWQALLDVEGSAIALSHAPAEILAVLPGFSDEAVARVVDMRRRNEPPRAFLDIANGLTTEAGNAVMTALPDLAAMVSLHPRAWLVQMEARSGNPPVSTIIETRLERAGSFVRITRRRIRAR